MATLFPVILFSSALVAAEASRGNADIALNGQRIDAMVATFMRENDVPGVSLAIVQAPYITRATGYGIADVETDTLVSVNTTFDIGEMRNAFTAVAIMQLVESGKLRLEDVLPLIRQPSEYTKLESLIERTSGLSYEVFIRLHQFEPLGLRYTHFAGDAPTGEGIGRGERHRRFLKEPGMINPVERAAGSVEAAAAPRAIYSSASDISVWDIALAGEILIRNPALRKLIYEAPAGDQAENINPSSGPWFFPGHPGLMIATGSDRGFSSLLARFTHRDELICVTLLANREGVDLTQLARMIAGAYNRKTGPPERAAGMRAQQSPYTVSQTVERLERALTLAGIPPKTLSIADGKMEGSFGNAGVWMEGAAVWVAVSDPAMNCANACASELRMRQAIDAALLETIGAPSHSDSSAGTSTGN